MSTALSMKIRTPELRARLNRMTQSELAQRAGLSKTTVSHLESGQLKRIELKTIGKLCQALSCNPNDLFEMPDQQQFDLLKQQKEALRKVIGSMEFDKSISPDHLDDDLVAIVDAVVDKDFKTPARQFGKKHRS